MSRLALERHQVVLYGLAIALGWLAAERAPQLAAVAQSALWPALALLLLATFAQIPLLHVRRAWRDTRFARAVLLGNFVAAPLLAWALVAAFDLHGAQRLGVLLVLLVPCTDWFITFTQLGRGDAVRAIAVTPLNLVVQLALLPAYLAVMADAQALAGWSWADLLPAVALVLAPLALAAVLEWRAKRAPRWQRVRERLAWWPVPLLTLVVGLIAYAHVAAVGQAWDAVTQVLPLFALYLAGALALAWGLARWHGLPPAQGRTLAFSLGTRNSFVVLPLALALPPGWEAVAVVIVAQSLVELLGMVAYVALAPRLWREDGDA
ncbi:bass: bile acid transporter [Tepidimonas alkaliphilus]|uniref:Bass: bile acid transporter n=1 Tax=Tepidimonas alkaliphilus TaxID=2588942 RepID=A0A554WB03_9BURK|nr:arsenic resistance protein [Tepidimonas alkaliphilus]TSE20763.1 bass: bile acid transporter [Tepidimonas alkaliphilus]